MNSVTEQKSRLRMEFRSILSFLFGLALVGFADSLAAADLTEARGAYYRGDYQSCAEIAAAEVERGVWNDYWSRLLVETLLTTGHYEEARDVYVQVSGKFSNSIPLRVLAAEAYRYCGEQEKGNKLLDEIPDLVQSAPWRYSDRDNLLAIGKYLLKEGEDARAVLDAFYDRSLKSDPKFVEAHLAIAELALEKSDFQEAVKSLRLAEELRPEDPYIHYLLARAWAPSDAEKASEQLEAALSLNPKHIDSLVYHATNLIDAESYAAAEELLGQVFAVNESEPRAWALRASIAHLTGNYKQEGVYRSKALAHWALNPEVDYLIGKTLSKHYRFVEGVKYQRRSLQMDPGYLPARFQLAQDLLRVGADDEGWSIVDQVAANDQYNVMAFNLQTLQKRLAQFTTIEVPGLIVRMDAREAAIYGEHVVKLLQDANRRLGAKYEVELKQPVTVEIFPQQSDFAIRTFGLPGGAGFLGVCFGNLITANSPASQGDSPSNWESVLWHEYCHVITLNKTQNRMPRWLSEGISVYEELEENPRWGQQMTPIYKEMVLGPDFVPLSQLSKAFLQPKSPMHLQFAYYESSLAVRYLIEVHGLPLMLKLLDDLGMGVPIEEAFSRRYGDPSVLDADFESYVMGRANGFLADTNFDREELPEMPALIDLARIVRENPKLYYAQRMLTERLVRAKRWPEALEAANKLEQLYPNDTDPGGALDLIGQIAKESGDIDLERQTLKKLTSQSSDNVPALVRLIELSRGAEAWTEVRDQAQQLLAVQPLIVIGHENLVAASRALGTPEMAVNSLRALMQMEPVDPARLQYELAEALYSASEFESARREVLLALEQSPRYRNAQKLLVKIHDQLNEEFAIRAKRPDNGVPPTPELP